MGLVVKIAICLCLLVVAYCGAAQPSSTQFSVTVKQSAADPEAVTAAQDRLAKYIVAHYYRKMFSSFAVAVFDRNGAVHTYYLHSDEHKQYATGSVTKLLTATLFQIEVDRKQLQPLEIIDRYYPDFAELRWQNQSITLQNLVTHTAGFPDLRYYKTPDLRKIESIDLKVPMPIYPPGKHYRYSNDGYIMLGHILKRVCESSIGECARREIFDPLQMNDSSGPTTGAGGFKTSVHDLILFGRMYLNGGAANGRRILSLRSINDMVQSGFYIPPSTHQYFTGRGWRVRSDAKGVRTMFHIGGANYVSAWLQLFPRHGVGICYLGDPPEYTDSLMNYLSGVQGLLGDVATAYVGAGEPVYAWQPDRPSSDLSDQFAGQYVDQMTDDTLTIYWNQDVMPPQLMAKGVSDYPLVGETHQVYVGGRDNLTHQFVVDPFTNQVVAVANGFGYYEKPTAKQAASD